MQQQELLFCAESIVSGRSPAISVVPGAGLMDGAAGGPSMTLIAYVVDCGFALPTALYLVNCTELIKAVDCDRLSTH